MTVLGSGVAASAGDLALAVGVAGDVVAGVGVNVTPGASCAATYSRSEKSWP